MSKRKAATEQPAIKTLSDAPAALDAAKSDKPTEVTDASAAAIHAAAITGQGYDNLPAGHLVTTNAEPAPVPYPAGYTEALQTALDIASTDLVNLETAGAHLFEQFPEMFESPAAAAAAIKDVVTA